MLDAGAFYAGVPFGSQEKHYTTPEVYDEVSHIKQGSLATLIQVGRLIIRQAEKEAVAEVRKTAADSGDAQTLSAQDVSVLALCREMGGEIVSDDYAVSNVASRMGMRVMPVMTGGIKDTGRWVRYCSGCDKEFSKMSSCPQCGNPLRKKLLKS